MTTFPRIQKPARHLVRWIARLVLLAFAVSVVGALAVVVIAPRAVHGAALTVLTGSMTPEIPVGSVVIVRPVDPGTLEVGDVATYQPKKGEDAFITHRIVEVHDDPEGLTFTFKGDANRGPDLNPIPAGAVRGEVWFYVPYLGAIRDALHGKGGISLVAMLLLAGYALSQLSGAFNERRTRQPQGEREIPSPDAAGDAAPFDRPLILASQLLPEGCADASALAAAAALKWGAIVVASSQRSYTLMLASPVEALDATLEALRSEQWLDVEVLAHPNNQLNAPLQQAFHEPQREEQDAAS